MIIKCKNNFINTCFYGALQIFRYSLQCLLHRKNSPSWNDTEFALAASHMDYAFTIYMNTCCNWVLFEQVQEHTTNVIWWYKQRARTSLSSKPGSACWAWVSNQVSYFKYVNMLKHINYTSSMLTTPNILYRIARFSNVEHLSIHISRNFGAESTRVYYIGLRGEFTQVSTGSCYNNTSSIITINNWLKMHHITILH